MKEGLNSFLPQWFKNYFYHLPVAFFADVLYGFPSRNLKVIGVTGTDGKTTTVSMIYHILKKDGKKVSMISTVNAFIGTRRIDTGLHVTSPDPFTLQKLIKEAVDRGSQYMILEATSHALDQFRFWGVKFNIGVITNITHEHLDYHKNWTNYFNTKAKLIGDVKVAILNTDEDHFPKLTRLVQPSSKIVSFGLGESADFNNKTCPLSLKIPGQFNILNGLAAAATCFMLGIDKKDIKRALHSFNSPTGRMEEIENDKGFRVIIDFAHTPNGLSNALRALRSQNLKGKLISLIGAEGKRDIKKRAIMGGIAQELSDVVIVTAVDPRGDIKKINKHIKKGAIKFGAKSGKNFYIIEDRKKAISFAINQLAKEGDTIGIFGKGHEASMNLTGENEISWSDKEVVLKTLGYGK